MFKKKKKNGLEEAFDGFTDSLINNFETVMEATANGQQKIAEALVDEIVKVSKRVRTLEEILLGPKEIKCKRIDPEAKLPTRKHPTDAGIDVYSLEATTIGSHSIKVVRTGVTFDFSNNTVTFVWPKSKNDHLVGAGVVDETYQGEILVKICNISDHPIIIPKHTGIGQLVIVPVLCPEIKEVDEIHEVKSERGDTGGIVGNS